MIVPNCHPAKNQFYTSKQTNRQTGRQTNKQEREKENIHERIQETRVKHNFLCKCLGQPSKQITNLTLYSHSNFNITPFTSTVSVQFPSTRRKQMYGFHFKEFNITTRQQNSN